MANEYDELLAGGAAANEYDAQLQIEGDNARQALRSSMFGAVRSNPDQFAEAKRLSTQTGVPAAVVERNLDDVRQRARLNEYDGLLQTAPTLARQLAQPDFAKLAQDDTQVLSAAERSLGDIARNLGRAAVSGFRFGVPQSVQGIEAAAAENTGGILDAISGAFMRARARGPLPAGFQAPGPVTQFGEAALARGQEIEQQARVYEGDQTGVGFVENAAASGFRSVGQNFVPALLSILTRNPAPALAGAGTLTGGQSYLQGRESGLDPADAARFATGQAAVEVGTELFPEVKLLRDLSIGSPIWRTILNNQVGEQLGEQVATALQDFNEFASLPENADKTIGDYLAARPEAALQTAIATAVGSAIQSGAPAAVLNATDRVLGRRQAAQAAEQDAAAVAALAELAAASKLRERDPQSFQQFIEAAATEGGVRGVYVDARTLVEALQQSGVDVAAVLPTSAAQIGEALAAGGDVRIPVSEFATYLPGTGLDQTLLPHLKTDPEGLTQSEAQAFTQDQAGEFQRQAEELLTGQQTVETEQAAVESVKQQILAQLQDAGRFSPAVNDAYASLMAQFYSTQAQRTGVTPEELLAQYPLQVRAEAVTGGSRLEQIVDGVRQFFGGEPRTRDVVQIADRLPGETVLDQSVSPEFKRWFGDWQDPKANTSRYPKDKTPLSQVVDDNGAPLVLYHATNGDFSTFETGRNTISSTAFGDVESVRHGIFATPDTAFAEEYLRPGDGKNVLPIYMDLKNPADMREGLTATLVDEIVQNSDLTERDFSGISAGSTWKLFDDSLGAKVVAALQAAGYDGAILREVSPTTRETEHDTYVAFRPEQIKSAIGNRGTFDPNDPSILNQGIQRQRGARGQIAFGNIRDGATISLFANADLSTFLHESGHLYLEVLTDLAARPNAPAEIQADMQRVLNWFGVADLPSWQGMTLEQKRPYHEQFARGFEAYLFEGKAPAAELTGLFQRFAAWLKNVYRQLSALNVELTDEVRSVFDRLLATDEQIAQAAQRRGYEALFVDPAAAGMTPEQFADYQAQAAEQRTDAEAALQRRAMRDMKWLGNAKSRALKALQKEAAGRREEVEAEVTAEVRSERVYRAIRFLTRGEFPDDAPLNKAGREALARAGLEGAKFNTAELRAQYGEDPAAPWRYLPTRTLSKESGLPADVLADLLGYSSGDALIRDIIAAEPEAQVIEGITDQRMLERYGDLTSPQALDRAVNEALTNEAHTRMLATELAALNQRLGAARELQRAAKLAAQRSMGDRLVKDIRPRQYVASESRAARAAERALAAGNRDEAVMHKRQQLLSVSLTREALDAQAEVDAALRRFRKMFDGKDADVAKRRDLDLVKAARAVLGRYGIGPDNDRAIDYLQNVERYDPGLYAVLRPALVNAMRGGDYRNLSVNDFRAMRDAVDSLWAQSKRGKEIEIDGKRIEREQAVDELVAQLDQLGGKRDAVENRTSTDADGLRLGVLGIKAALRRVEHFVRSLDQGAAGSWRKYIWQPISDGTTAYRLAKLDKLKTFRAELDKIAPSLTYHAISAPELGGFTFVGGKPELLHAMLHSGNQSNLNKLVAGYQWGEIREDGTVDASRWQAFLDRMHREGQITKADWDFVQAVWDLFDNMKPDTQRAFRDMYGMYFAEITASPVATPFGTYRGGYVPAKTDPNQVQEGQQNEDSIVKGANDLYAFPTTGAGFTKSRVESYTRQLQLDLRYLASHIDWTLRFTHIQPRVLDVYRTLRDRRLSSKLNEIAPRAIEELLTPWLQRTAMQQVEKPWQGRGGRAAQRFLGALRRRASMQIMSVNLVNAVQNFANIPVLALRVPGARIASALIAVTRSPKKTAAVIAEKSPFMRTRMDSQLIDLQKTISDIVLNPSRFQKFQDWAAHHGHFLSLGTQNLMDSVAWTAAYDDAIGRDLSELEAVRHADSVVRETQGSAAAEDISAFESGNAFLRIFTMFYTFFNNQANLLGTEFERIRRDLGLRKGAGRGLYVYVMGLMLPAVLGELIAQGLRGQLDFDSDDDDEWDLLGVLSFIGTAQRKYAAAFVPFVGQAANAVLNQFSGDGLFHDDRVATSAAVTAVESATKAPVDLYEVLSGERELRKRDIRDVLTLVGLALGVPAGALARPLGYYADVEQGKVDPEGPIDYTRGLVTGR